MGVRDTTDQLTRAEQVTVWLIGHPWSKRLLIAFVVLPVLALIASFRRDPTATWVSGVPVLLIVGWALDRMARTDLTTVEEQRVTVALLTGWPTGDARLDGWVVHRAGQAVNRRATGAKLWASTTAVALVLASVAVAAAWRSSPWWLLCLIPAPLYLAVPIAYAQSDTAAVLDLVDIGDADG